VQFGHAMSINYFLQQADGSLRTGVEKSDVEAPGFDTTRLRQQVLQIICFGVLYGCAMGTFGGIGGERFWQLVFSGVKVPLLLLVTFVLALPSFFVMNNLVGVGEDFPRVLRALVTTQAVLTIVLASLAPFTLLWYASSSNYRIAIFFNSLMFAVASITAQFWLRRHYAVLIARDIRHRTLLRLWLLLYAFVGIQMGWVLRPFIGDPGSSVQFFRADSWGNAYVILSQMLWRTLAG